MMSQNADPGDNQSVVNSVVSGHVVMVGHTDGDVNIRLGKQSYYVHPLAKSDFEGSSLPRSKRAPSYLLDPIRELVPYVDRPEQAGVLEWCNDDESAYSAMLLAGAGGMGKTRLARHVATTLTGRNWDVVEVSRIPQPGRSNFPVTMSAGARPLLAIVDYSDRWPLGELVQATSEILTLYAKRRRVRLLFIARSTALWKDTAAALDSLPLDIVVEPLKLGAFASEQNIGPLFNSAVLAFSRALGVEPPAEASATREFGNAALTMHMAALASVLGYRYQPQESRNGTGEKVSTFLLRHERRYWQSAQEADAETMERLVFIATLAGPMASIEALETVKALTIYTAEQACQKALRIHRSIYPPVQFIVPGESDVYLIPLRPDRLGEDFIAECLMGGGQTRLDIDKLFEFYKVNGQVGRYAVRSVLDTLLACATRHAGVWDFLLGAAQQWSDLFRQACLCQ